MKLNNILIAAALMAASTNIYADNDNEGKELKYRRSSLYSLMVNHTDQNFAKEIREAFVQMPVPDKYNDHDQAQQNRDQFFHLSIPPYGMMGLYLRRRTLVRRGKILVVL